ncbi:MAG TPA: MarR family transcriptional regulator [Acidiphilium sp.]|uniref:MarR family winged helix-turn-helix transcriptional regulator n=1 Tax=Acidiphilium sp. TaxID=527 RepID=UPI000BC52591|nr:MarR family transcriptional regulator [Acidiphilium sp.]OZB39393.1 MAG: MarR family transcriptional regulator [Acidiphilium sp. 34-60-192]HQT89616.1 MarR family transcriptional regulator [Acidiphilium sp.]
MLEPHLTDRDYRTLASFRFALRQFLTFSEAAAREAGLTPRQHQALLGIKNTQNAGGAGIGDLASFLILHHNSTVELVDRLVRAGYVKRGDDTADRRRVLLSLTELGEARLAALSSIHLAEIERIGPELKHLLSLMPPAQNQNDD